MENRLTLLHRALLWLSVFPTVVFGVGYFFNPVAMSTALDVPTSDPHLLRYIGGFLIGSVVGSALALRSGNWSEVRVVTIYLATWNILNSLAMLYGMSAENVPKGYLPNAIITGLTGAGLAYVAFQRRQLHERR